MSIILKQPITGPAAWSGPDLENDRSWLQQLTPDIIDGLDHALAALKAKGLGFPDFTREDFPSARWAAGCPPWPMNWKTAVASRCCAACRCTGTPRTS